MAIHSVNSNPYQSSSIELRRNLLDAYQTSQSSGSRNRNSPLHVDDSVQLSDAARKAAASSSSKPADPPATPDTQQPEFYSRASIRETPPPREPAPVSRETERQLAMSSQSRARQAEESARTLL